MTNRMLFLLFVVISVLALPCSVSAQGQNPKHLVEKAINVPEILSIPSESEFQVIFVDADATFQKVSPLGKDMSTFRFFSRSLFELLGIRGSQNSWVSHVPFFSLLPKRGERESVLYLKFQLQKVQAKQIRRATLLIFGPSREELETAEGEGYEESLVKLMNSVNLWFSSYDQWKETPKSYADVEEQYLRIRTEMNLGSPTLSPVYSGCYFWDATEIIRAELVKDKIVTFVIRNENSDLGYGVNLFSSKMHRLWPRRIDKSPRLVFEFAQ